MTLFQVLFLALIIDYFVGDPERLWDRFTHPIVYFGRAIDWLDQRLNKGKMRRAKGILAIVLLVLAGLIIGRILKLVPDFRILEIVVVTILIAHKSLIDHVKAVAKALDVGIEAARREVAKIVGRDPGDLDESGVATAAIESCAENFSDGVVAPVFWFLVLGLPGIIVYKIVNTADSMIGHKSETYNQFGWAAAKLDDLMNWIPARLCGALMCLVTRKQDAFELMRDDAPLHASPNAGWPEAAMAGILDIRLAGPRVYDGELTDDPYINSQGRSHLDTTDIGDAVRVVTNAWIGMAGLIGIFALIPILS